MAFICYNKANLKGVTMKLTLQKQDKELIHNMFAIAKKILKLSAYLVKLENNKQKDSLEYKKYQEYLTICLEIEEKYYKKIDINKIYDYTHYTDTKNLFYVFSDYDLISSNFFDLYPAKRVFNKLTKLGISHFLTIYQNNCDDPNDSFDYKIILTQLIDEEIKSLFSFLIKQEITKEKNSEIKDKLTNIPYIINFLNPSLNTQDQDNHYFEILPAFLNTFKITKKDYKALLNVYFQRYIKVVIKSILKMEDKYFQDNLNFFKLAIYLNLLKAFLLIDKNNLNKFQNLIYDIINEDSNNKKSKEKIKSILKEVKNFENIIFIDIERLFDDEDSKRF